MPVTQDATSGKYVPASGAEWTTLLSGSGIANPSLLYLCQEASGNLTDTLAGATLTKFGSPAYQETITGWSTKAVRTSSGANGWVSTNTNIPDPSATSIMMFSWTAFPNSGSNSWGFSFGTPFITGQVTCEIARNAVFDIRSPSGFTNSVNDYSGTTRPLLFQFNKTASTLVAQTDLETVSRSASVSSSSKTFYLGGDNGANTNSSGNTQYLYIAIWSGSAAEIDATHRASLINLLTNGPAATGGGRLVGSPLTESGLVKSPLVNCSARMPGPTRYWCK